MKPEALPDARSRLRAERVLLAARLAPAGFLSALLFASILWVALLDAIPLGILNLWYGAAVLTGAARWLIARSYLGASRALAESRDWSLAIVAAAALSGAVWGLTGWALFPPDLRHQVMIAFVLAGVAAAESVTLSALRLAYPLFVLLVLAPVAVALFRGESEAHAAMAATVVVMMGALIGTSFRVHANIVEAAKLKLENLDLVLSLTSAKEGVEAANERLKEEMAERELAQERIRASEQRLSMHVEQTPLAVIEWGHGRRIRRWNPAAQALFGWSAEEVMGREAVELLFVPEGRDGARALMDRLLEGERPPQAVARHLTRDRGDIVCEWHNTPLVDGGRVIAVVSIAHDITERVKVERMKREFISTVSHELRTPLTSIRGALGLLAGGVAGELPADARGMVDIAHQNSQRLLILINDMLDMDKIELGMMKINPGPVEVMPLARQALESHQGYADQFDVRLELRGDVGGALIQVDRDRLMQILSNLLSNAIKFSPRGESVVLEVGHEAGRLRLIVADRGSGIPEEFRARIFQKFSQADASDSRQKGGTGLGLAITKALAERMDGQVGFESAPGQGSTFWVEFPHAGDVS